MTSRDPVRTDAEPPARRPRALLALGLLLLLEALGMVVVTGFLVLEDVTGDPAYIASAIALTVLAALAVVFLAAMGRGALRGAKWIRSAATVWHFTQGAVGLWAFTGQGAQPVVAVVLLVPALAALGLLFSPSVLEATRRR